MKIELCETCREASGIADEGRKCWACLRGFSLTHGIIQDPGKFEGECRYVPYYWDLFLNGGSDWDNGKVVGFKVAPEEKVLFPELKRRRTVNLIERSDGFVIEKKRR